MQSEVELRLDFFSHVLYAAIFTVVLHFHCHPTFESYFCRVNGSLYRSPLLTISQMELSIIRVKQICFFFLEFVCVPLLCVGWESVEVSLQKLNLLIQSEG